MEIIIGIFGIGAQVGKCSDIVGRFIWIFKMFDINIEGIGVESLRIQTCHK